MTHCSLRARWSVAAVTALALATAGCSDGQGAASSTSAGTSAVSPSSIALTSTTPAPASTAVPATTDSAAAVITRPYIDPSVCGAGAKAEYVVTDGSWVPFAVAASQPSPLQVFASPTNGVAEPFAVVLRIAEPSDRRANDHPVSINGAAVSIDLAGNGNGSAAWTLPDGTWAYLRTRDLDEAAIVALVARLTPRDATAPIPGFDLAPSSEPDDLVLLHEQMNSGLSGTVTRFQCSTTPNAGIYHVDVLSGDPVYVYFGIIDRPRPYVVAVNGSGAIAIDGPADRAITPAMVTNADPGTWDAIPAVPPNGP